MNKFNYGQILSRFNTSLRYRSLIHTSRIFKSEQPSKIDKAPIRDFHELKVSRREKLFLVWSGNYKSVKDVPNYLNQSVLEKSRNKARIKINIIVSVLAAFGFIFAAYLGKKAAARGETISSITEENRKKTMLKLAQKQD